MARPPWQDWTLRDRLLVGAATAATCGLAVAALVLALIPAGPAIEGALAGAVAAGAMGTDPVGGLPAVTTGTGSGGPTPATSSAPPSARAVSTGAPEGGAGGTPPVTGAPSTPSLRATGPGGPPTSPGPGGTGTGSPVPSGPGRPLIDLRHWALTVPVLNSRGEATTVPSAHAVTPYLSVAADGALVFWCPVAGARTATADYARTELRERLVPGDESKNWTVARGGTLTARLAVAAVPRANPELVVGQIHGYGGGGPLVLMRWENGSIVASIRTGPTGSSGSRVRLATGVALGAPFSYLIEVSGGRLILQAAGGAVSSSVIGPRWAGQPLYFKAGAYLQAAGSSSTDGGRAVFWAIDASH